jgi:hypothetical protein
MGRPRLLAGLALAGSVAAAVLLRRRSRQRERVDVYFEDGAMVSLGDGSAEAATILPLARRIIETARP